MHIDLTRDSVASSTWYDTEGQEFDTSDSRFDWDSDQPKNEPNGLIAVFRGLVKFHDTTKYHAMDATLMCFQS